VPLGLDLGAVCDPVAEAQEDVLHLLAHLGDRVDRAERLRVARQRHVGRVALQGGAQLLRLERGGPLLEGRLDGAPDEVGRLAHLAAPLGRQPADPGEHGRERAAAAGVRHPRGLELREVGRAGDRRERLLLDPAEVGLAHRPVRVSDPVAR
jgi:hypothetical protein